jgi:heptaprenylglyceryl phosphate synthase
MNPGYIVKTKSGKVGRTYHMRGIINKKIAVYLCIKEEQFEGDTFYIEFSEKAILCAPETLKMIGFID